MLERCRSVEHIIHNGDLANVPLGYVVVEVSRLVEHGFHGDYFAHVPFGQVLAEIFGTTEHFMHAGDLGDIPLPNWSVRPRRAIAHWRQFEACVDSGFEVYSVLWWKRCTCKSRGS